MRLSLGSTLRAMRATSQDSTLSLRASALAEAVEAMSAVLLAIPFARGRPERMCSRPPISARFRWASAARSPATDLSVFGGHDQSFLWGVSSTLATEKRSLGQEMRKG